jgi:hypothetical protein
MLTNHTQGTTSNFGNTSELPRIPIRFVWPCGVTFKEMQENVRKGRLYRTGDAILVWVNQGDFLMNSPQDLTALSKSDGSPEGVKTGTGLIEDDSAVCAADLPDPIPDTSGTEAKPVGYASIIEQCAKVVEDFFAKNPNADGPNLGPHVANRIRALYASPLPVTEDIAGPPEVIDWLRTELSAIDTWYRGSPSYEHDAGWMKDKVYSLLDHAEKVFTAQAPLPVTEDTVADSRGFELAIRAGMHASLEADPTNGPCRCDLPVTDARRPTHCHLCGQRKRPTVTEDIAGLVGSLLKFTPYLDENFYGHTSADMIADPQGEYVKLSDVKTLLSQALLSLQQERDEARRLAEHRLSWADRYESEAERADELQQKVKELEEERDGWKERARTKCGPECYADDEDPNCLLEHRFMQMVEASQAQAEVLKTALEEAADAINEAANLNGLSDAMREWLRVRRNNARSALSSENASATQEDGR